MAACPRWREQQGPGPARHVLFRCPDARTLAQRVVQDFRRAIEETLAHYGEAYIALAGGNTPREAYRLLAREGQDLPWERIHIYWTDERGVPPEHPRSNYRMIRETLLEHIPIPKANIHRIPTELGPEAAARQYHQELAQRARPLDWVLLGMGTDGHTASLFPHTPVLEEQERLAAPVFPPGQEWRVTLTYPALNAARWVRVLVQGTAKAPTVARVLAGPFRPKDLPIQNLAPGQPIYWFLDPEALAAWPSGPVEER